MRTFLYYQDFKGLEPVKASIEKLKANEANKIVVMLEALASVSVLSMPYYRQVRGFLLDFGELRIGNFRIFVHKLTETEYLLLHLFRKKSDETPSAEIDIALKRLQDYYYRYDQEQN
jgi:phage-related protein